MSQNCIIFSVNFFLNVVYFDPLFILKIVPKCNNFGTTYTSTKSQRNSGLFSSPEPKAHMVSL